MSKNNRTYSNKIKKMLKELDVKIDPLIEATLEELDRLTHIRNDLYDSYNSLEIDPKTGEKLFREHTNKAGATNIIITQEVTEYKNYSDKFNKTIAALEKMIDSRKPEKEKEEKPEDPLAKIIRRETNG